MWIDEVTSLPGPTPGLRAQVGVGPEGTNPAGNPDWTWVEAAFNVDAGNNDEFLAQLLPSEPGDFDYVYRCTLSDGAEWLYADLDGPIAAGDVPPNPGKLTVLFEVRTVAVTFHVTAPASTLPEDVVYIAGSLSGLDGGYPSWDPGAVALTKVGDYEWTITFTGPEGLAFEYKYTLGTWDVVERGEFCEAIANRGIILTYGSDGTQEVYDTVLNWMTVLPCTGIVEVTFNVTVPEVTPPDATVYIAGTLSRLDGGLPDWDPGGVALTKVSDYEWAITLTGTYAVFLEFKYTLGSWEFVEKDATCEEIGNRVESVTYGTQTIFNTVLNWRNVTPCGD